MASTDDHGTASHFQISTGLNVSGHIITDSHYAQREEDHYPYDCQKSHCIGNQDRCKNSCCYKRLDEEREEVDAECQETWGEVERLCDDLAALKQTIGIPFTCEYHPCDFGFTAIGTCENRDTTCISCNVQISERAILAFSSKISVTQRQIKRLQRVIEKKKADIDKTQATTNSLKEPLNSAKHHLHELKTKIGGLESTAKFLTDGEFSSGTFWANASDDDIEAQGVARAEATDCSCDPCKVKQTTKAYENAVQRAEKYQARLTHDVEHPEELKKKWHKPEAEQESIQESTLGESRLAHTGTRRKQGPSNLKGTFGRGFNKQK